MLAFVFVVLSAVGLGADQFCDICCMNIEADTVGKVCGSHTMCKYQKDEIGPSCKGFVLVRFTPDERKGLVNVHNSLRSLVAMGKVESQPESANMRCMVWSEELAAIAERWAAQCVYGNDICRDLEKFPVGQNIAKGSYSTSNETGLVHFWFQGSKNFNNTQIKKYKIPRNRTLRHYAQLVWADSYLLGCARAIFQQPNGSTVAYKEHLICNYGPTGNIPNQSMYRIGKPCSECQQGTTCSAEYEGLCAAEINDDLYEFLGASPKPRSFTISATFVICMALILN